MLPNMPSTTEPLSARGAANPTHLVKPLASPTAMTVPPRRR
jgi:hypothetical protein